MSTTVSKLAVEHERDAQCADCVSSYPRSCWRTGRRPGSTPPPIPVGGNPDTRSGAASTLINRRSTTVAEHFLTTRHQLPLGAGGAVWQFGQGGGGGGGWQALQPKSCTTSRSCAVANASAGEAAIAPHRDMLARTARKKRRTITVLQGFAGEACAMHVLTGK